MSFEIRLNGKSFALWERASITRSLDAQSGGWQFTSSAIQDAPYPVKVGDRVEIVVYGRTMALGYVDCIEPSQDEQSHSVTVAGRDLTQDLIDSSVPDAVKAVEGPVSLRALCERTIKALGASIVVREQVQGLAEFDTDTLQAAESGQSCMDFLSRFARKRQVFLVSDGRGALVIYRPGRHRAASPIIHERNGRRNNVKAYKAKLSNNDRFRRYVVRSQDNMGADPFASYSEQGTSRTNEAVDTGIRASRYLEIKAEESMDEAECKARAAEEANVRRARATEYQATVPGVLQADGAPWDMGLIVSVNDEYAGLRGDFLIREVTYQIDLSQGSTTAIVCAPPDAYMVKASTPAQDERRAKTADSLQAEPNSKQDFTQMRLARREWADGAFGR